MVFERDLSFVDQPDRWQYFAESAVVLPVKNLIFSFCRQLVMNLVRHIAGGRKPISEALVRVTVASWRKNQAVGTQTYFWCLGVLKESVGTTQIEYLRPSAIPVLVTSSCHQIADLLVIR